jgi:hypothetical protein
MVQNGKLTLRMIGRHPRIILLVSVLLLVVMYVASLPTAEGTTAYNGVFFVTEHAPLSLYPNSTIGPWTTINFMGVAFHMRIMNWFSPAGPVLVGNVTELGVISYSFQVGGPELCACWISPDHYSGIQYDSAFGVLLMVQAPTITALVAVGVVGIAASLVLLVRKRNERRLDALPHPPLTQGLPPRHPERPPP